MLEGWSICFEPLLLLLSARYFSFPMNERQVRPPKNYPLFCWKDLKHTKHIDHPSAFFKFEAKPICKINYFSINVNRSSCIIILTYYYWYFKSIWRGAVGGHLTGGQCFVVAPCLVVFLDKLSFPTVDDIFVLPWQVLGHFGTIFRSVIVGCYGCFHVLVTILFFFQEVNFH